MYKIVFIDIDGTLLNKKGEVTQATIESIQRAQALGVKIVLCSGRISTSTEAFAREIGANEFVIAGNGSTIIDLATNEEIYSKFMDKNKVIQIIDICDENSISYNIYTLDEILTKKIENNVLFYHIENRKLPEDRKVKIHIYDNLRKIVKESENKIYTKITISDKHRSIFNSIIKKLRQIKDINVLDVSHSSVKRVKLGTEEVLIEYNYTEVSKANVNKWTAIEFLINKLNIYKSEVIAIGDNINDIEMVVEAGLGVMMGNAAPWYKEKADVVAPSNDEDGVAYILNEYIK